MFEPGLLIYCLIAVHDVPRSLWRGIVFLPPLFFLNFFFSLTKDFFSFAVFVSSIFRFDLFVSLNKLKKKKSLLQRRRKPSFFEHLHSESRTLEK